ncbi:MAG: hypothetical protein JO071_05290 [Deltaproteobacteria bacterium]|nr:hypothetical protein [Deltaproteobacteria bacterium]
MKAEPLRSTAGRSIQPSMTSEKSTSEPAADSEDVTKDTALLAVVETDHPIAEHSPDTIPPVPRPPANTETSAKPPGKPIPPKPTEMAKPVTAGKAVTSPKPATGNISPLPRPAEPQPSLPVSMIVRPDSAASASGSVLFPGELEESFESASARVELAHARNSFAAWILKGIHALIPSGAGGRCEPGNVQRMIAFDGFHNGLFEEKCERDRRYGTVYCVSEEVNAFLVRLELPRRMPKSSLKQTWVLPDEMPDYVYVLNLMDNVLCIRAGLPDEARRRLSYISPSFPSDFQTRIEFQTPVEGYKHRLQNKVLEIIVYKKSSVNPA